MKEQRDNHAVVYYVYVFGRNFPAIALERAPGAAIFGGQGKKETYVSDNIKI